MKNVFIAVLILIPFISRAQQDSSGLSLPIKDRIVFYEKEYRLDNAVTKDERYNRALAWFTSSFPDSREALNISDKEAGKITGTGIFKVITGDSRRSGPAAGQAYYWVKFIVTIYLKEDRCTFQAYNYYEKPTEKGVTNDYSKVEYRWRDFVKGKPWTSGDQRLFKGLDQNTLLLMASLEKEMKK
jgi:hypothetical protein